MRRSSWIIPDRTFYPYSLYSIGDNTKTVLMVSSENQIYTLVFKNITEIFESDEAPHKTSCINLHGTVSDTVVTSHNTISRKDDGKLIVFKSFRECEPVGGIAGVKAICSTNNGAKLLLMRLINHDQLQLELLDDVSDQSVPQPLKIYDLSWEKTSFETSRKDQSHKVATVYVSKENLRFFQRFFNCKDLSLGTEQVVFTIDNGLFWIKEIADTYEVVTLKLYPASINEFGFASSTGCFSVILENAMLAIYCISEDPGNLLIQEQKIFLGPNVESFQFISDLGMIIYSNGDNIVQLRYFYSELSKSIQSESKEISIAGVTGITYLNFARTAICITENCLIYAISITPFNANQEQQNGYFELTDELLTQAKQMTCYLTNELNTSKKITHLIEQKQLHYDVLTRASNMSLYRNLIKSTLLFHKRIPDIQYNTLYLGESFMDTFCCVVSIDFTNDFQQLLIRQKHWILSAIFGKMQYRIKLSTINYFEGLIQLVHPITKRNLKMQGFPDVSISLSSVMCHFHDCLSIQIPIDISNATNISSLFEANLCSIYENMTVYEDDLQYMVCALVNRYEQRSNIAPVIECSFEKNNTNVTDFLNDADIRVPSAISESTELLYLHIGGLVVKVHWNPLHRNKIRLASDAPFIILLLKMAYYRKCIQQLTLQSTSLKAILLQVAQCEVQRGDLISYYRQIRTATT
ncbi:uncharacterized protein LOC131679774 isoform X2 [Topomyia yanbarensis]|uniref:uncharacterized protein LOC131679774 isoform X2 n=1 Tax=Topomyia yanbarensis TaxID=2498891 RepID=UPI00273B4B4A|nr:uncharacterized protein LOC131679774 isoform X2 [Topomyia yanbarensis]